MVGHKLYAVFCQKTPSFSCGMGCGHARLVKRGGERKSVWYTLFVDVLNRYGIPWCRKFATLMCQLEFGLSEFYITFYAFWMMGMSRRTGCLHWVWNVSLRSYPPISVSELTPTTAHQTFLFVSNSIKPGKHACSSDFYSVLRTKAEVIYDSYYAIHVNHIGHINTRP